MLMDVIPLDAGLVKGSHGIRPAQRKDWPVLISERADAFAESLLKPTQVSDVIQRRVLAL
jgi:hypothetical protein